MKRISLAVCCFGLAACAVGTTSSRVDQKHKGSDGVERTVTAERSGFGIITQQPLLTPGRESIDTAIAGAIDRSPAGLYGPYGMYGGFYGPYSASGQIMPYGLGWAHPIGGYTAAGMARAAELQPLVSPATPTYQIIQAPPIPTAPPAPSSSGGGGKGAGTGNGGRVTGGACVPRDLLQTINETRDDFLEVKGTKPLNRTLALQLLDDWQADIDDAVLDCRDSNPAAATQFEAMRKEVETLREELRKLGSPV